MGEEGGKVFSKGTQQQQMHGTIKEATDIVTRSVSMFM